MRSFADLRKNADKFSSIAKLTEEKQDYKDNRFWKLGKTQEKTGTAVIRFLPATSKDALPIVQVYEYSFGNKSTGFYIESSPSTIGLPCPVMEANAALWADGTEESKSIVRSRARKKKYIANILVVKDPANSENNGKVFLFKFGEEIFNLIKTAEEGKIDEDTQEVISEPISVCDFWKGANLNLKFKVTDKHKFGTYEDSYFGKPAPLSKDDDELESIFNQEYDLQENVLDEKNFKPYDVLLKRFEKVTGQVKQPISKQEVRQSVTKQTPTVKHAEPEEIEAPAELPESNQDLEDDIDALLKELED